jgi:hypothetical protein
MLSPARHEYKSVVRVAVNNNFNCTEAEYRQLAGYVQANPTRFFFVNSNIKTPALRSLNDHPYKAVITVNPDLIARENEIVKLYSLDQKRVAFVRVKYIPDSQPIVDLIQELSEAQYPVVITIQRFNSKAMLTKYARLENYHFDNTRGRLCGEALTKIQTIADTTPGVAICDRQGLGCQGCGLCSTLTVGQKLPLSSLNMSSSGLCGYNCPDCYAKTMQNFLRKIGQRVIKYDVIKQNEKQAGRTEHIKRAKAALSV